MHKKKHFNLYLSFTFFLGIIIASGVYVFLFGHLFEEKLNENKQFLKNQTPSLDLETIKRSLQIQYGVTGKDSIKICKNWKTQVNASKPLKPLFDRNYIYVASKNKFFLIDKKEHNISKKIEFKSNILHVELLPGNLLCLFFKDKTICYLNQILKPVWKTNSGIKKQICNPIKVRQVYIEEDMLLNRLFLVIPNANSLKFINAFTGKLAVQYKFNKNISAFSSFDTLDKCFYVINGNYLECISIK